MPWLTVPDVLKSIELEQLAEMTSDPKKPIEVLEPDALAGQDIVETPFYGSAGAGFVVRINQVPTTQFTVLEGAGPRGEDWIKLTAPLVLALHDKVTGSCVGAVNVAVLDEKLLRAQADIRAVLSAALWMVPADTDVAPEPLKGWSWDIAAWLLCTDARRPGLITASGDGPYSNVLARYQALVTGYGPAMPSIFATIRSGGWSGLGILNPIILPITGTGGGGPTSFDSNAKIFGDRAGIL